MFRLGISQARLLLAVAVVLPAIYDGSLLGRSCGLIIRS